MITATSIANEAYRVEIGICGWVTAIQQIETDFLK